MHARSLFAVALAAVLAGPVTAHAQAKQSTAKPAAAAPATPASTLSLGGWIGYETGDLDGLQLRADGIMPFKKLAPTVDLSFVGSLGYSYLTDSESGFDFSAHVFKIVPAARFTFPLSPQFSLFGDAGLGLYIASVSYDYNYFGFSGSESESDVGLMLRFGGGGLFQLNPRWQLSGALMVDPMFGDYDDTTVSFLVGVTYKL